MKIAVTGATGFIGKHVIQYLINAGYKPIAVGRNKKKLQILSNNFNISIIECDIKSPKKDWVLDFNSMDIVVHLAWDFLNDYNNPVHFEKELPAHYNFLKTLIKNGVKKIIVAGTCFEYGLQNGLLSENSFTNPITAYGIAKDSLRRYLSILQKKEAFSFTWLRYFYLYGAGQNKTSLFSQLDFAIEQGELIFNMSGGEQIRDYLSVEKVAKITALLTIDKKSNGIYNICSGKPVSIKTLVEKRKMQLKSNIKLNLGYYPYPEYEPMAFWGDNKKTCHLMETI